jgi:hypothetical protein
MTVSGDLSDAAVFDDALQSATLTLSVALIGGCTLQVLCKRIQRQKMTILISLQAKHLKCVVLTARALVADSSGVSFQESIFFLNYQ